MAICEDIVSDVFASLWDKRNSIELKKDTATAYLKICVRNSCLNYLKHLDTNGIIMNSAKSNHLSMPQNQIAYIP